MSPQVELSPRPTLLLVPVLGVVLAVTAIPGTSDPAGLELQPRSWNPRLVLEKLEEPGGVAIGKDGSIHISESMAHRVSVFDGAGRLTRRFGKFGRAPGDFDRPHGIAVAADGSVYVADTGNSRIQVFSREGRPSGAWGKHGLGPGEFLEPLGIAVKEARVYVTDGRGARVQVFDLAGKLLFYVWSHGHKPGQLGRPVGVAVDAGGNFYVSDSDNGRIQRFDRNGRWVLGWGDRGSRSGLLSEPRDVAYARGVLYVADSNNERVPAFDTEGRIVLEWQLSPHRPTHIALSPDGNSLVLCEAPADRCRLFSSATAQTSAPQPFAAKPHLGPTVACAGNLFLVSDRSTEALLVFDFPASPPRPLAVLAAFGFETSEVVRAGGADIDSEEGSVLVSDAGANRLLFFQVAGGKPGNEVTTRFVKSLTFGPEALGPRLADWHLDPPEVQPGAVVRDGKGNTFLADLAFSRIVVLDRDLRVVRSWGRRGNEDGRFVEPAGLAWSAAREILYVVDSGRRRVQAFDAEGSLRSAWGRRGRGEGAFEDPTGIAVGRDGSVYVADRGSRRVQRFTPEGRFVKAWGGRGSREARLARPEKVVVDGRGRIVVIDPGSDRIFVFTPEGKLVESFGPQALAARVGNKPAVPDAGETSAVGPDGFSTPIRSSEGTYLVRYRTEPSPIPLNEPFSMEVLVHETRDPSRLAEAIALEVDARMPAHGHGMSRAPKVRALWEGPVPGPLASYVLEDPALGNGRYDVRGMLFHMPGTWTVDFDLTRWAITERAQVDLSLD